MSCTIIKPKSHDEWLDVRKSGIGSSEVGTILGVNPWETPLQLWRRKMGIDAPKVENFAMKAGHYLEDAVSRFYADETGKEIIKASAGDWIMRDNDKPFLQVSPDRTFWIPGEKHNSENKGILECKTTQMEVSAEQPPKHWFCQLQYQLHVAGYRTGALAWLTMGRTFGYRDIDYNADFCAWMVEEIEKFWVDNIQGGKQPDPLNVEDMLLLNPRQTPSKTLDAGAPYFRKVKDLDGERDEAVDLAIVVANLKGVKQQIAELTKEKEAAEDIIKMAMADAEALIFDGKTLATWKAGKDKTSFDAKTFKAENAELYNKYTITTPGARTFLVK